jgi:hypothetical protein
LLIFQRATDISILAARLVALGQFIILLAVQVVDLVIKIDS